MNGTVKWFNNLKGYGFITGDDQKDIFVHYSNILSTDGKYRTLELGDKVSFEVSTTTNDKAKGKLAAVKVQKIIE